MLPSLTLYRYHHRYICPSLHNKPPHSISLNSMPFSAPSSPSCMHLFPHEITNSISFSPWMLWSGLKASTSTSFFDFLNYAPFHLKLSFVFQKKLYHVIHFFFSVRLLISWLSLFLMRRLFPWQSGFTWCFLRCNSDYHLKNKYSFYLCLGIIFFT